MHQVQRRVELMVVKRVKSKDSVQRRVESKYGWMVESYKTAACSGMGMRLGDYRLVGHGAI